MKVAHVIAAGLRDVFCRVGRPGVRTGNEAIPRPEFLVRPRRDDLERLPVLVPFRGLVRPDAECWAITGGGLWPSGPRGTGVAVVAGVFLVRIGAEVGVGSAIGVGVDEKPSVGVELVGFEFK